MGAISGRGGRLPHPPTGGNRRSADVLTAPLGDLIVAYDLVGGVVHLLNATAAALLDAGDATADLGALATAWAKHTDTDRAVVERDLRAGIEDLRRIDLVGRPTARPAAVSIHGCLGSALPGGGVHAVLDEGVRFHSSRPDLLAAIDAELGIAEPGRTTTVEMEVGEDRAGVIRLTGGGHRAFDSRSAFLGQLPSVVNEVATDTSRCVALHAGAVRARSGAVVLLPARSGSGKSTLTGALVQAGWDYLGDEAIGVHAATLDAMAYAKPLALDGAARSVLGLAPDRTSSTACRELRPDAAALRGRVGPISLVVLPTFVAGAATTLEPLSPRDAVVALLEHTLNLSRVGQPALSALCQVAEQVEVQRLVHGGVDRAVPAIEDLLGSLAGR